MYVHHNINSQLVKKKKNSVSLPNEIKLLEVESLKYL